jgi:hypothetical protein
VCQISGLDFDFSLGPIQQADLIRPLRYIGPRSNRQVCHASVINLRRLSNVGASYFGLGGLTIEDRSNERPNPLCVVDHSTWAVFMDGGNGIPAMNW